MSEQYRNSYKAYSAWNFEKEIEELNHASEQGWQLIRGGCFHSRFIRNPDVRYRYQLDYYRKIEDMPRYIETFREQGWEYINSTFNGWHYFRKIYDPALPESAYEIFTDRESAREMSGRWARVALIIGLFLAVMAVLSGIRTISRLCLPRLLQTFLFGLESFFLLRGVMIMRNPDVRRSRREEGTLLSAFLVTILVGAAAMIALESLRPSFTTAQVAASVDQPLQDSRWSDFKVTYPDFYYLDLEMEAEKPMTFQIIDSKNEIVYSETGADFQGNNIRLKLPRGQYSLSISYETGFKIRCTLE